MVEAVMDAGRALSAGVVEELTGTDDVPPKKGHDKIKCNNVPLLTNDVLPTLHTKSGKRNFQMTDQQVGTVC